MYTKKSICIFCWYCLAYGCRCFGCHHICENKTFFYLIFEKKKKIKTKLTTYINFYISRDLLFSMMIRSYFAYKPQLIYAEIYANIDSDDDYVSFIYNDIEWIVNIYCRSLFLFCADRLEYTNRTAKWLG